MARSPVVSNAKEFVKRLDGVSAAYHRGVVGSMATSADLARNRAVTEHMNPRGRKPSFRYEYVNMRTPTGGEYVQRRKVVEKSDKLFVKTGRLADALQTKGSWNLKKNLTESRFSGTGRGARHWLAWIRPQASGNTHSYLMRLSLTEAGDPMMKYRILHEKGGVMRRNVSGQSFAERRQFLIQGRPFLGPSINKTFSDRVYGGELFKRLRGVEAMPL